MLTTSMEPEGIAIICLLKVIWWTEIYIHSHYSLNMLNREILYFEPWKQTPLKCHFCVILKMFFKLFPYRIFQTTRKNYCFFFPTVIVTNRRCDHSMFLDEKNPRFVKYMILI